MLNSVRSFREDRAEGIRKMLMMHRSRIEMHGPEYCLHDRSRTESADQSSDPDLSSQKPADEGCHTEHQDTDKSDRHLPCSFGQSNEKRITRTAAERSSHINILCNGDHDQAQDHERDRSRQRSAFWDPAETVEEIDGFTDNESIDEHRDTDRFLQQDIDDQNDIGDRDRSCSVKDAQALRQTEVQHIPGSRTDICLDREIDPETVKEQAQSSKQRIEQDRSGRTIVVKIFDKRFKLHD